VLCLDQKCHVVSQHTVYQGTVNASVVRPAEVFRPAVIRNCPGIIVVHNHPSGDPTPSPEDIRTTEQLRRAGDRAARPRHSWPEAVREPEGAWSRLLAVAHESCLLHQRMCVCDACGRALGLYGTDSQGRGACRENARYAPNRSTKCERWKCAAGSTSSCSRASARGGDMQPSEFVRADLLDHHLTCTDIVRRYQATSVTLERALRTEAGACNCESPGQLERSIGMQTKSLGGVL
jgi:RadC-like JAB domain-containing protein